MTGDYILRVWGKMRRTLADHRPWLLLGIIAAIAFFLLMGGRLGGLFLIAIKGIAVGSLAIYAARKSHLPDARLLALVLALSAVADMMLELYFSAGGAIFFAAWVAALALYLRNLRERPASSQKLAAVGLLIFTPVIAWLVTLSTTVAIYALMLGAMAGAAWMSRFPRYRTGTGAILVVASNLMVFARVGGDIDLSLTDWLTWPLYFSGQFLIATGVIQTLRYEAPAVR